MDLDTWASSANFKGLSSKQRLAVLKSRLPIQKFLAGEKMGREEGPVKKYLTNGKLAEPETKLLRNYIKQVDVVGCSLAPPGPHRYPQNIWPGMVFYTPF